VFDIKAAQKLLRKKHALRAKSSIPQKIWHWCNWPVTV